MTAGIRRTITALTGCLLLSGCAQTVEGSPTADSSAVPRPETGSFSTTARSLGAPTHASGQMLESLRMAETIPYLFDIDPALHLSGTVRAEGRAALPQMVRYMFGTAAGTALRDAEVGTAVSASNAVGGGMDDPTVALREVTVSVFRMASSDEASRAVGPGLLAAEDVPTGGAAPPKVVMSVPRYGNAVAYSQDFRGGKNPTIALVAHDRYVIGVRGDLGVEQIRAYFDKQTAELDRFIPTPLEKVTTLALDRDGVAGLTVAPADGATSYAMSPRVAALQRTDVQRSVRAFADAGVDAVGVGAGTTSRAKDAPGAARLADALLAEYTETKPSMQRESVPGVPRGTCLTYRFKVGSDATRTTCVVPVGRHVAEFTDPQRGRAIQGIGAAYLILDGRR
ncbi:hypothetical protein AXK57_08875 [Tsukamurella pulmonis]|uniref:Uncharacterized protein n=1 Tax=Tsukamurella pulmonis TaxID=47312 RepID=A0A1H1BVQ9_9ACTN|nr:hypothetical protein [Tsukamurella pulmonis]KXO90180.1 hypothetical protein AXK56_08645 [Tsukamurella pulmonis]KXP11433.1 hypothetical protein AXK57_08875 [Tsukamurella pulmonis]RDH10508.1 hypothetical protein DVB88_17325 [Tsukamurella pulmonis]SDQ56024.1 hypothetical protein SAMN04489765_0883 [Tsukamurella pulmonis]SUP24590.1 Uncharacterised protein [Tsukamurella pulmonis]